MLDTKEVARALVQSADVIALDVVGTIVETAEPFARTYSRFAQQFDVTVPEALIADRVALAMKEIWGEGDTQTDEDRERERWEAVVRRALPECESIFDQVFDEVWVHFSSADAWVWYDDARALIDSLAAARRCWGLASNFDGRLHLWAKTQRLLQRAPFVRTSADLGYLKRDPAFYTGLQSTARWAGGIGYDRSEIRCVMIGDQPANDYLPAIEAGWQAISVCRTNESWELAANHDRPRVRNLRELT